MNEPTFFGFPKLDPDQHPIFPQWVRATDLETKDCPGECWRRFDGLEAKPQPVYMADDPTKVAPDCSEKVNLVAVERANPLPAPPVLPTQVRFVPHLGTLVVGANGICVVHTPGDMGSHTQYIQAEPSWPLLWGPAVFVLKDGRILSFANCQWKGLNR